MGNEKSNAAALLPIGVFLVIFLGSGVITGDFYAMPAIVAFLIALFVPDFFSTFGTVLGVGAKAGYLDKELEMKISLL